MATSVERSTSFRSGSTAPRRRVFLLVCIYRIACGILLLSVVYATDSQSLPWLQGAWSSLPQGGLLLTLCLAYLAFGFFCVAAAERMQKAPAGWLLLVVLLLGGAIMPRP